MQDTVPLSKQKIVLTAVIAWPTEVTKHAVKRETVD